MRKLPVYVWTSNQLNCCLPAHAYLFNKFWPIETDVKILGYDVPNISLPDNFEFISLGEQRGPDFWSDDMIKFFSECTDDYFYFPTEDQVILDKVDIEIFNLAVDLFESGLHSNLIRFCLAKNMCKWPHNIVKDYGDFQLIERIQNTHYRNSLHASIWHRKNFLKQLKPGMSPWSFELSTGRENNMKVLGTKGKYGLTIGHGYKRGKKLKNWYKCNNGTSVTLNDEDFKLIEKNNWMPSI
tara:strand:+ start:4208 stop:4927 length:720 start_codon:yes stop_codon:yes gene_type:complete